MNANSFKVVVGTFAQNLWCNNERCLMTEVRVNRVVRRAEDTTRVQNELAMQNDRPAVTDCPAIAINIDTDININRLINT